MEALHHSLGLIARARDLRADLRNLQSALAWNMAVGRSLCGQGERIAIYEELVEQQQRERSARGQA